MLITVFALSISKDLIISDAIECPILSCSEIEQILQIEEVMLTVTTKSNAGEVEQNIKDVASPQIIIVMV